MMLRARSEWLDSGGADAKGHSAVCEHGVYSRENGNNMGGVELELIKFCQLSYQYNTGTRITEIESLIGVIEAYQFLLTEGVINFCKVG